MARTQTLELLDRLVGFDTVSSRSNLALIDHVEAHLGGHGASCRRFTSPCGEKASLMASFGPAGPDGIILSGHTDVVPTEGQAWSGDPFTLRRQGSRLLGRGTTDMKGFDAVIVAMADRLATAPLRRPVHLALSYDEEVGCTGVIGMLEALRADGFEAAAAFIGEPTSMNPVIGHKWKVSIAVEVKGLECHSSQAPSGVNALDAAARIAVRIGQMECRFEAEGARDDLYDVPHSTAHVGVLNSGTALNIVPNEASMIFEFRCIGGDDPQALADSVEAFARAEIEPAMKAVDPASGIRFTRVARIPGIDTNPNDAIVGQARRCGAVGPIRKVAFGTEAGLFHEILGVPALVCGPGSIDQAHKPDEFIEEAQLALCEAFVERLIEEQCA